MHPDGSINFEELGRVLEHQIAHGTDAIIICGTTGECSHNGRRRAAAGHQVYRGWLRTVCLLITGAGSNDTKHGCALAAQAAAYGADALLMVTPYYNKTTQAGLVAHFTAMAEAGGIPVIL